MKETIVALEDLISYIEDEWDWEDKEIAKDAEKDIKALEQAIQIIKSKDIVGTLSINGENYNIMK